MNAVRLFPVILSSLLIAAHFLRTDSMLLVLGCFAVPLLLVFPERWAARAVQAFLICSALVWVREVSSLVQQRMADGQAWMRLATILSVVAIVTAASAFVFLSPALKDRYKLN